VTWERGYDAGYQAGYAAGARGGPHDYTATRRAATKRHRGPGTPKRGSKPRKLTAHNRFMKKEMRSLRRKHPRMKQTQIMKKANAAWRKKKRGKK